MRVKIIGTGAAGNKGAVCAVKNNIIDVDDVLLINSTLKDIPYDYKGKAVQFYNSYGGCGKERAMSKKLCSTSLQNGTINLEEFLQVGTDNEAELVVITTSTEGGSGSGSAPLIASYIRQVLGISVHIYAYTGFEEDARGVKNTVEFFQEMEDTFTVEAVQDYLVDPLQEATSAADRLPNNLVNAVLVFNNAFPQSMYPASTDVRDKIRATGSTANVIPGGGSSVEWDANNGTTTINYSNCVQTQGVDYSYGYLTDETMSGTDYEYNDYTKEPTIGETGIKVYQKGKTKVTITGFNKKTDEYGITVADYAKKSDDTYSYQRGTASSLGICPIIDAKPVAGA